MNQTEELKIIKSANKATRAVGRVEFHMRRGPGRFPEAMQYINQAYGHLAELEKIVRQHVS